MSEDGAAAPAAPATDGKRHRGKPWMWIVAGLLLLILAVFLAPVFAVLGLAVLITAVVALVKDTPTWLRLRSRKAAMTVTAVSAAVFLVSASITAAATESDQHPVTQVQPSTSTAATPSASPATAPAPSATTSAAPTAAAPAAPKAVGAAASMTALALLARIPIKGRAPMTGYSRTTDFGAAWLDMDRNGCDTRNDILARDLTEITKSGRCVILTGILYDAYTGRTISFTRGVDTSALVQIDHMVALGDAWQTGAQNISLGQREMLANDPLNLDAVEAAINDQKGDGDAATWLPPLKAYRCTYVARQISVKAAYGLWVTQPEHDAMTRVLNTCPRQTAYKSTLQPLPPTTQETTTPSTPPSTTAPAPAPSTPPANATQTYPKTVTPGAFCAKEYAGWIGYTKTGKKEVCKTALGDIRLRWRAA